MPNASLPLVMQRSRQLLVGMLLLWLAMLGGCASTKFTTDDGRPVNPELFAQIQRFGQGEQALRPAIVQTAALKDDACDHQWELPISVATSQAWEETDRIAWVRALGVDERVTVIATAPGQALQRGDKLVSIDGYENSRSDKMLAELATLRDRGKPFVVKTARGQVHRLVPIQVCRGYARLAPPNTPLLQDYHWLMSYHPLEVAAADLTADEALWTVLWTQGLSEEGGARMKTYHYGTKVLGGLYTLATIATGVKGAAMAAEAAIAAAQKAAASAASEILKQQLIEQAKQYAANRMREEATKAVQQMTQSQIMNAMQAVAANRGTLGGVSRIAATVFDRADAWAFARMKQLGADPLAGVSLHQKMLERGLVRNALAFDAERLNSVQGLADKEGRGEQMVALLKGLRPEMLEFELEAMPLASAKGEFSYDQVSESGKDGADAALAGGLIEAMLGAPDTAK